MKRGAACLVLCVLLAGWVSGQSARDRPVNIVYDPGDMSIARYNDDSVIANIKAIHRSESDVIVNRREMEPDQRVNEILDRPIRNHDIRLPVTGSPETYYSDIGELLAHAGIVLARDEIHRINDLEVYQTVKIEAPEVTLVVSKVARKRFTLFVMEYAQRGQDHDFALQIGSDRAAVLNALGTPTHETADQSLSIYHSFRTLRQINIHWRDDRVERVQLVSWDGI